MQLMHADEPATPEYPVILHHKGEGCRPCAVSVCKLVDWVSSSDRNSLISHRTFFVFIKLTQGFHIYSLILSQKTPNECVACLHVWICLHFCYYNGKRLIKLHIILYYITRWLWLLVIYMYMRLCLLVSKNILYFRNKNNLYILYMWQYENNAM